tara:strand:+ start:707 stop:907 length:201 start_codon:yes stop_codon:yes gene_type:complete
MKFLRELNSLYLIVILYLICTSIIIYQMSAIIELSNSIKIIIWINGAVCGFYMQKAIMHFLKKWFR